MFREPERGEGGNHLNYDSTAYIAKSQTKKAQVVVQFEILMTSRGYRCNSVS